MQVNNACDIKLRLVSNEAHFRDLHRMPIERDLNRGLVAKLIVEHAEIQAIDDGLNRERIDVGELPHHSNATARDGGGEGRDPRVELTQVGVKRRVSDREGQLCIHLGRHRDQTGARHRQPW